MHRRLTEWLFGVVVAALFTVVAPFSVAAQQVGTVVGRVTNAGTLGPLATVQVSVRGTGRGGLTNAEGTFLIPNVPVGTHTIEAVRIGFSSTQQQVTVTAGANTTVNLAMTETVLQLQEIVATGLVDPTEGVRAPISVAHVDREMMPVIASGNAVQNLQGRLPGMSVARRSGQPGEGVNIVLRTPTSLLGNTSPLVVVDGVILGGQGIPSTSDIDAMDIESIEVIRGAAASSLYGSRAASGVISIKTKRGSGMQVGQTRFQARTELGQSMNVRNIKLNDHHHYLMNSERTAYVNAAGVVVPRSQRVAPPLVTAFMDKPYPSPIYDNISAITRAGAFRTNNFSVSGNTQSTNFAVSLNNYKEEGSLIGNEGYNRNSFRVNLDHRFIDALNLGVSVYHSRDGRENISGNPFNDALRAPRDVDFSIRDENGNYVQQPDPNIAVQNPLWTNATRENDEKSTRTLGNLSLAWNPLSWFGASGSVGYDRSDSESRSYVPKGTPLSVGSDGVSDGSLSFNNDFRDTWNAEGQVTLRRDFGPMNVRTTFRGLLERENTESGSRSGSNFILIGIPQLNNIRAEDRSATSSEREIRALGYLWDTAFDYDGKYIVSVLGRRDGSSLFGKDNRWHNYYRVAGAWRVGQESWFNVPNVQELKFSFAQGTAGGRPGVTAQYETWTLSGGIPTKGSLGNTQLKPERTTEREWSMNMVFFERFGLVVTHARQRTVDQLVQSPLPAITGYTSQWVNAGVVSGHSTEFELEAQFVTRPNIGWTSMFVADYSNSVIEDWQLPCSNAQAWRYLCTGVPAYGLYSRWLLKSHAQLNQHRGGDAVAFADQFEVNDEGFLVWVGQGNHYWEGMSKNLWGTVSQPIGGKVYAWGMPFEEETNQKLPNRTLLGETNPINFGWINNVRLSNVTLHAQLHTSIGGDANNRNHQLMGQTAIATAPRMDQFGKPDGLKKPIQYFRAANDSDKSYSVEDASYLKLRTVSAHYNMPESQLGRFGLSRAGVKELQVGLIVRNVFTITNYDGFDPEAAVNLNTRENTDGGGYPPTRSLTAEFTITF
jgi:TonB-linked SusC/RagA family outer membrane protein